MNLFEIKIITQARISKLCLEYFGYKPSNMDITQKLSHISRINNKAPCDMILFKEHIIKTMKKFIASNYPIEYKKVIEQEIRNIKNNPSKVLPLP